MALVVLVASAPSIAASRTKARATAPFADATRFEWKGQSARLANVEVATAEWSWVGWPDGLGESLSKQALRVAQSQRWTCTAARVRGEPAAADRQGRAWVVCPALTRTLVEQGLGVVLWLDPTTADLDLLQAQRDAMKAQRGLWAHGVSRHVIVGGGSSTLERAGIIEGVRTTDGVATALEHRIPYARDARVCLGTTCMVIGTP